LKDVIFSNPAFFYLLLLIPFAAFWYWAKYRKRNVAMMMPSLAPFGKTRGLRSYLMPMLFLLRMLAIAFIIIALARPQNALKEEKINAEGIDIVIAIDVSTSMLAEDLKPNRIEAAKNVAKQFIEGRTTDRVGLVVFSGESFTQCPITTDHDVIIKLFDEVKSGVLMDGTAIGMGVANAVARLKDSKAKSKVIILLTDGENNAGNIDPLTAAEAAAEFGIKAYTIGVGTRGYAPYPSKTIFGSVRYQNIEVKIDEDLLKAIAEKTDGKYFRATNTEKLGQIWQEIDKLEKTKIEVTSIKRFVERFHVFARIGLLLFGLELFLRYVILRPAP